MDFFTGYFKIIGHTKCAPIHQRGASTSECVHTAKTADRINAKFVIWRTIVEILENRWWSRKKETQALASNRFAEKKVRKATTILGELMDALKATTVVCCTQMKELSESKPCLLQENVVLLTKHCSILKMAGFWFGWFPVNNLQIKNSSNKNRILGSSVSCQQKTGGFLVPVKGTMDAF